MRGGVAGGEKQLKDDQEQSWAIAKWQASTQSVDKNIFGCHTALNLIY